MFKNTQQWMRGALSVGLLAVLLACGGGGVVPGTGVATRTLSPEMSSRKAVAYSPYRSSNRDTEVITDAMVLQDLQLLSAGGFKLIRLFDSSDAVAARVLRLLAANPSLDIKVMLGAYILSESSPYLTEAQKANSRSFNAAEVARAVVLAKSYPSLVLAVSVGNETMVGWSFVPTSPALMASYISTVRNQITQPVTTDDSWSFFARSAGEPNDPKPVLNTIDFVSLHTYPLLDTPYNTWDWMQTAVPADQRAVAMMDAAIAKAKADYAAARAQLDSTGFSAMPIVIGETGWKASPTNGETGRASPANQRMYLDRLSAWAKASAAPKAIVYFEAFDEPWKGSDNAFGLFNVSRQPRCAIKDLYPTLTPETSSCTDAQAQYYVAPVTRGTVTANRYSAYMDTLTAGEARPGEVPHFDAWDSGATAAYAQTADAAATIDPGNGIDITPKPAVWGWGLALGLPTSTEDLSNFNSASGRLNFSINTTYAGKLEIGFFTGSAAAGSAFDVYLPISSGQYGYVNDGKWHEVSIPIKDITPRGAMAYGMTDPNKAKLDMSKVQSVFVIADRYAVTGNSANVTTRLKIDAIYWSK